MAECAHFHETGWQQEAPALRYYLVFLMWSTPGKYPGALPFSQGGAALLASPRKNEASLNWWEEPRNTQKSNRSRGLRKHANVKLGFIG